MEGREILYLPKWRKSLTKEDKFKIDEK